MNSFVRKSLCLVFAIAFILASKGNGVYAADATLPKLGDVNNDTKVNSTDLLAFKKHLLGVEELDNRGMLAADVNSDGKVNSTDFLLLKQYALGIIEAFPERIISAVNLTDVASSLSWQDDTSMPLFYSNNPERLDESDINKILYRDSNINSTGKFRVFWSHDNETGAKCYIGMAIYNNTGKTIKVNFGKRGNVQQSKTGVGGYIAGQTVLKEWLSCSSSEYNYKSIDNGKYTYVSFAVETGAWGMGMYDVIIRDTNDNIIKGGITVKTYVTSNSSGDPTSVLSNNILAAQKSPSGRASYNHASKSLIWNATSNQQISFTSTTYNSWKVPQNDMPYGIDECDGTSNIPLRGCYGMDLNVTIKLSSKSAIIVTPSQYEDQKASMTHYFAAHVSNRGVVEAKIPDKKSWVITTGNAGDTITIKISLPANDYAPIHLGVIPMD